ncbi:MAG: hypothetical protein US81_C0025G0001, partial [Parcubacteria group bacterium GW2011_GWE2_38_18]
KGASETWKQKLPIINYNYMTKERWQEILGQIKDSFSIEEEGSEHLEEEGGVDIDFVVFNGPLGRMKLELISRPVVLDKKTIYSKRIGSNAQVEYVYSDHERSFKLMAYKWDESADDWIEMDAKNFG